MDNTSFTERLKMAWQLLVNSEFAGRVAQALQLLDGNRSKPVLPPERVHASGLMLLATLQREGRLLDFLQQDISAFSDEDVGAAARVVHGGCRKAIQEHFQFEPAVTGSEGAPMAVPAGFDAQRIRLTGEVHGQPPFRGTLKHHGWVAKEIRLPEISETLDPRVIAAAEVELS